MSSFTQFWRRDRSGSPARRVALLGFGKHPAWADHVLDLGESSPSLIELRRRLYSEGVLALLGAWETLPPERTCPFDHWLVWIRPEGVLLGRIMASTDRVGRSECLFSVVADLADCPLALAVRGLAPRLDEFSRRCQELPSPDVVRAAFANERGTLESYMLDPSRAAGLERGPTGHERQELTRVPGLDTAGQGLARLLYKAKEAWAPYALGPARKAREAQGAGVLLRVPCLPGNLAGSVLLWEELLSAYVEPDAPRLYLVPATGDWLDLVVGQVEGHHFFGLRANRQGHAPETEVNYPVSSQLQAEAAAVMAAWTTGQPIRPPAPGGPTATSPADGGPTAQPDSSDEPGPSPWPRVAGWGLLMAALALVFVWWMHSPDALKHLKAQAEASFAAGRWPEALQQYRALADRLPKDTLVQERLRLLTAPPKVVAPSNLVAWAGQRVRIDFSAADELKRQVRIVPAPDKDSSGWGPLTPVEGAPGAAWWFRPAATASGNITLHFVADNGLTSTVAQVTVRVEPDPTEEALRQADLAWEAQRYPEALAHYRRALELAPTNALALERVGCLTSPPVLIGTTSVVTVAGRSVEGTVKLQPGPAGCAAVPWRVEVNTNELGLGQFVFQAQQGRWQWRVPTGRTGQVQVAFRVMGPTATSAWQTMHLTARLPVTPGFEGLPKEPLRLEAGVRTALVFRVATPAQGLGPTTVRLHPDGPASPPAPKPMLSRAGPDRWTLAIEQAQVPGVYQFVLIAETDEACATQAVQVAVSAVPEPALTSSASPTAVPTAPVPAPKPAPATAEEPAQFPGSEYVWVDFPDGGVWPGKTNRGLWVCRYEVSQREYRELMGSLPDRLPAQGDTLPVTAITPWGAQEYCNKLTGRHRQNLPSGWQFRLPTKNEWHWFSDSGAVPEDAVFATNRPQPVDVGSLNKFGVRHTAGNVAELAADGQAGRRYVLGQSFRHARKRNVAHNIESFRETDDRDDVGFRVVLAGPPGQSPAKILP